MEIKVMLVLVLRCAHTWMNEYKQFTTYLHIHKQFPVFLFRVFSPLLTTIYSLLPTAHVMKKSYPVSCGGSSKVPQEEDPFTSVRQYDTVNSRGSDQHLSSTSIDGRQTFETLPRKLDHLEQGNKDSMSSFDEKVNCSLDYAINKLFSS